MNRYAQMFHTLSQKDEAAFIPFTTLGFPDFKRSINIIEILVEAGADAIELGIPFSDPIADGPIIQKANIQALESGITPHDCNQIIKAIRTKHPSLPIGILTYGNLVVSNGVDAFMKNLRDAGADSILIADLPTFEAGPFRKIARRLGLDYINILPPNPSPQLLSEIAQTGMGYTYLLGRAGVTGTMDGPILPDARLLSELEAYGGPPAIQGFGISAPSHLSAAINKGAKGVISGSKVISLIEDGLRSDFREFSVLKSYLKSMKAVTRGPEIDA